jgi:Transposase DDE domain
MTHESLTNEDWDWAVERLGGACLISALARETKAFVRARGIGSAIDLLRLTLSYCLGHAGLRGTAAWAEAMGVASVSDVALFGRFRNTAQWLSRLAAGIVARGCPEAAKGRLIRILDGSSVPKAGREARRTNGLWRIHASFELPSERFDFLELTDQTGGERLDRVPVVGGELRMADAAFLQVDQIGEVMEQGADVLVRGSWRHARWLDASGAAIDLLAELKTVESTGRLDRTLWLGRSKKAPLEMRVVALRKPPAAIAEARRKARLAARKQGRQASVQTLYASEWVILVTSLTQQACSTDEVFQLYRMRWRIELAFKRLKSLIGLRSPPTKDPALARAWILAHLLMILLVEPLVDEFGVSPS